MRNNDPFAPWNSHEKDDPSKPWNDTWYKHDHDAPWNNPYSYNDKDYEDWCNKNHIPWYDR